MNAILAAISLGLREPEDKTEWGIAIGLGIGLAIAMFATMILIFVVGMRKGRRQDWEE